MRHEYKYIISEYQRVILQNRMSGVFALDKHANDGSYKITSLYFDNHYHSCFYDNENGNDPRGKFRIRNYKGTDYLCLEYKSKHCGMTDKVQQIMNFEQLEDILAKKSLKIDGESPALFSKFELERKNTRLLPDVIVEYERVPYVYSVGNIRVTFDMNICASSDVLNFPKEYSKLLPVLPTGMLVMEVKYDDILPGFIEELLQVRTLGRSTFSKFYLCKKALQGGLF